MGMSTHVVGFKPADEKFIKMREVYNACNAAGVAVPREVEKFFEHEPPPEAELGVRVDITAAVKKWQGNSASGYELDLSKLDPDVRVVRFYNAW